MTVSSTVLTNRTLSTTGAQRWVPWRLKPSVQAKAHAGAVHENWPIIGGQSEQARSVVGVQGVDSLVPKEHSGRHCVAIVPPMQ